AGWQGHGEGLGLACGAQGIGCRAVGGAGRLLALVADEPLFLLRMDTTIALADLASGRAVAIGAECRREVHDAPPGCAWKTLSREVCPDPRFLYNCTTLRFGVELPCDQVSVISRGWPATNSPTSCTARA